LFQPSYQVHRVDLHNELKRVAFTEDGIGRPCKLYLGSHVVDCDTENTSVTLASNKIIRADLIVVAEGVKVCRLCNLSSTRTPRLTYRPTCQSVLRKRVHAMATEPKISGIYAHRFTIPMDEAFMKDPETQWIIEDMNRVSVACEEDARRLVNYPVREGKVLNCVAICDVSVAPYLANIGEVDHLHRSRQIFTAPKVQTLNRSSPKKLYYQFLWNFTRNTAIQSNSPNLGISELGRF
jgi:hypothetical protein